MNLGAPGKDCFIKLIVPGILARFVAFFYGELVDSVGSCVNGELERVALCALQTGFYWAVLLLMGCLRELDQSKGLALSSLYMNFFLIFNIHSSYLCRWVAVIITSICGALWA